MAALEELAQWEPDVYQIELTDPVVGGPDGISNRQAKQLGNRTQWLKAQLQQLLDDLDGLQPLDATLTALAGLQTVADQLIYATGPDAFATSALTALARQLLAAGDQVEARTVLEAAPLDSPVFTGAPKAPTALPGTNTTQLANTAFVQAAIAALVDSSPAALNTLNELATALGNDPNFATTVMNAIAGRQAASTILTALAGLQTTADQLIYTTGPGAFATSSLTALARQLLASADQAAARSALGAAPLDSPTFTGSPKAPTALPGTNTTQLANTAFVQTAIAALVDSSPAALNTLNELAAALGDDPNFATTVTNALAGKQAASVNLNALAGLAGAADKLGYFTGAGAMALTAFTAFARTLAGAADALAARTTLGACGIAGPVSQTLSGTALDITGIPSWAKRVVLCLDSVTVSAGAQLAIRLGGSGGIEASGYLGSVIDAQNDGNTGAIISSTAFALNSAVRADTRHGRIVIEKLSSQLWTISSNLAASNVAYGSWSAGSKSLASALSTVRLTTLAGTASLGGNVSVTYEG